MTPIKNLPKIKLTQEEVVKLIACRLKGHKIKQIINVSMDKEEPPFQYICSTCSRIPHSWDMHKIVIDQAQADLELEIHYDSPIKTYGRGVGMIITDEFLGVAE